MTERGAQHGDAATEILGNALRLYSDAKLLFENGRFASCASLSVLAIEELAKFMGTIGAQFRSRRARDAALDLAHLDGVAKMRLHSVSSCNPTSASCGGNNRCTGSRVQGAGRP